MFEFYTVYGERARGVEPVSEFYEAKRIADMFELIVNDTETGKDVYDIRKKGE